MAGWKSEKGRLVRHKWMCDCNPRQYAKHFETKKPGPNKGKWFYVCQKDQKDKSRCGFFLWDDDAKTREKVCLSENTDSEVENRDQQTSALPPRRPTPPPAYAEEATSSNAARKRGRAAFEQDEDDFGGFDQGDPGFDNELAQAMEAAETPRKAARIESYTVDPFTTPGRRKLPWKRDGPPNGLPTPQTEARSTNLFPTPFANPGSSFLTPSKFRDTEEDIEGSTQDPGSQHSTRSLDTPTPARFRDLGTGSPQADAFSTRITNLLTENGVRLNLTAEAKLRSLIASNTNSRQATRDFFDKRIDRIEHEKRELNTQIGSLERQLEEKKALVRVLNNQIRDLGSQPEFE